MVARLSFDLRQFIFLLLFFFFLCAVPFVCVFVLIFSLFFRRRIACGIYYCEYFLVTVEFQEQLTSTIRTTSAITTAKAITNKHVNLVMLRRWCLVSLRQLKWTLQHLQCCHRNHSRLFICALIRGAPKSSLMAANPSLWSYSINK